MASLAITRGKPVLTLVTVTNSAGADFPRMASMSMCAAIASRSGFIPSGLTLYGESAPLDKSHAPKESRSVRPAGPQSLRANSAWAGAAMLIQNERSDFRASVGDPFASALATMAALIAPALVPESYPMARLRLPRIASSTPQVYAPHEPSPCSARPMGLRAIIGRTFCRTIVDAIV